MRFVMACLIGLSSCVPKGDPNDDLIMVDASFDELLEALDAGTLAEGDLEIRNDSEFLWTEGEIRKRAAGALTEDLLAKLRTGRVSFRLVRDSAAPLPIPDGWNGTGVLKHRAVAPPQGAPLWTTIELEIIDNSGKRYLRASADAARIKNTALARSTAANRARQRLAQELGVKRLAGAEVTDYWAIPGGATFVRAPVEVPPYMQPGQPLR